MSEVLSVAQHRLATRLGIKQRQDGSWGFKLRCAWRPCANTVPNCYCSESFDAAVQRLKGRSNLYCSRQCWVGSGDAAEFADNDQTLMVSPVGQRVFDRMLRKVKAHSTKFTPQEKTVFDAWADALHMERDGDADECECEVPP